METAKRKVSVFTKGQIYQSLLTSLVTDLDQLKSVKEMREHVRQYAEQWKPQARGRRVTMDLKALQAIVDEQAAKMTSNSPDYLAGMVAHAWNLKCGENTKPISFSHVRKLVVDNKLNFPTGFNFVIKTRKRKPAAPATEVSE